MSGNRDSGVNSKWSGVNDGEHWTIEASYDRYSDDTPFVVDVWINFDSRKDDGIEWSDGGAFLSPGQARELAARLERQADLAEAANRRVGEGNPSV